MSNQIQLTQARLQEMSPVQIADDSAVKEKFVAIFNRIHGAQHGEQVYEMEAFQFKKRLAENPSLQKCTPLSLYGAFIDMAAQGLSFDSTKKLCYLVPNNVNVGTRENAKWETRASLEISPYGELAIRQMCGQIRHADEPVVVYQGDAFEAGVKDGRKYVNYQLNPSHTSEIIGCFIHIVKPDGSSDYAWLLKEDIARLKSYSDKKNRGNGDGSKANALYSSVGGQIDPGFLKAKCIKHAFKSSPKIKLGMFSKEQEIDPAPIDYGVDVSNQAQLQPANVTVQQSTAEPITTGTVVDDEQY